MIRIKLGRAAIAVAATLTMFGTGTAAHAAPSSPDKIAAPRCEAKGTLEIDGAEQDASNATPGVGSCFSFTGKTGDDLTVGLYLPGGEGVRNGFHSNAVVRDPSGQVVASYNGGSPQVDSIYRLPIPTLTSGGTYQVEVGPVTETGLINATVLLNRVQDQGRVELNGPGKDLVLKRVGQEHRLRFAGRAEQFGRLKVSGFNLESGTPGREPGVWVEIWSPDGQRVVYRDVLRGNVEADLGPLRQNGDFLVKAWTVWGSLGSVNLSFSTVG